MITPELIKKTAAYVKMRLYTEPSGHDWYHVERVWKMAKYLQKKEGGDLALIELSSLLHDVGDEKDNQYHPKNALIIQGMMDALDIDEDDQKKVFKIVSEIQYRGNQTFSPSSLEGQIVQDADFLDALGAIGVARTFATGGYIGRMIYDPFKKPRRKLTKDDYVYHKTASTSFNYFTEKLLTLPKFLNTATAKKITDRRVKFLDEYIEEFLAEVGGEK